MSKFMRIVSTLMVIIGLAFLFVYVRSLGSGNVDILNQPSYYTVRSYWFMFVTGIITVIFSILGSFFSWFKMLDPVKEALPNAGYASSEAIQTWVGGTTADAGDETEAAPEIKAPFSDERTEIPHEPGEFFGQTETEPDERTEILWDSQMSSDETEILLDWQGSGDEKTEVLREEETL